MAVTDPRAAEILLRWLQRPRPVAETPGVDLDSMSEAELERLHAGLTRVDQDVDGPGGEAPPRAWDSGARRIPAEAQPIRSELVMTGELEERAGVPCSNPSRTCQSPVNPLAILHG
jgi:hypothetical protein